MPAPSAAGANSGVFCVVASVLLDGFALESDGEVVEDEGMMTGAYV